MTSLKDTLAPLAAAPGLVFHGISFDPSNRTVRTFDLAGFDAELADPVVFSWIDIEAPDIEPLNEVLRRMDIDLVLVSHFDRPEVLPRIVERPDCLAFNLYPIYEPDRHLDTAQTIAEIQFARMILILGADYVITYHRRRLHAVEQPQAALGPEHGASLRDPRPPGDRRRRPVGTGGRRSASHRRTRRHRPPRDLDGSGTWSQGCAAWRSERRRR